jgi:hypothetical protein
MNNKIQNIKIVPYSIDWALNAGLTFAIKLSGKIASDKFGEPLSFLTKKDAITYSKSLV